MTSQQLKEIEEWSALLFSAREIAILMQVSIDDMIEGIENEESNIYISYQRGKLRTISELRKTILTQAKQGSSPSQNIALKLLDEMNAKEHE